jgi:hypothetical protein
VKKKLYAFGTVKDVGDAETFPGTFEVILSTPEVDRDGESIEAKAFEPLPDHMSFDIDHGMSVATTVGSGVPRYDGDKLKVAGTWSSIPEAQKVRTLVREGHVRSTSVAFMGAEYETKDGVPTIVKAEILNGAFTPIPSNRGANVITAKAFAEMSDVADPDRIARVRGFDRPMFKGHGLTASVLSEALNRAIEEAHGGERSYAYLIDYTDTWAVFRVYSMKTPARMLQQDYEVTGNEAKLTGDAVEVVGKVVYEPVKTEDPKTVSAEGADTKSASSADMSSALAEARAVIAQSETAMALSDR